MDTEATSPKSLAGNVWRNGGTTLGLINCPKCGNAINQLSALSRPVYAQRGEQWDVVVYSCLNCGVLLGFGPASR